MTVQEAENLKFGDKVIDSRGRIFLVTWTFTEDVDGGRGIDVIGEQYSHPFTIWEDNLNDYSIETEIRGVCW